jgi:DNA-binding response OmpR family regulator
MDFLHPRQQFQVADIEIDPRSHRAQHGLPRPGRPVHLKPHLHQVLNHLLNLPLIRNILHRHNHKKTSASSSQLCS